MDMKVEESSGEHLVKNMSYMDILVQIVDIRRNIKMSQKITALHKEMYAKIGQTTHLPTLNSLNAGIDKVLRGE